MAVEPQFSWATRYSDSLATVGVGSRSFYVDRQGQMVIAGPFGTATAFVHGLAAVRLTHRHVAYIDKTGATVFDYFLD
jgi:hypothetical protein